MALAKMTLIGLMNYYDNVDTTENTLFDLLLLPDGIDKNTVINNIIMKGGEFPMLYPNAPYVRAYIGVWGQKWYRTFDKWNKTISINYNPLYNYDRVEIIQDTEETNTTRNGSRTDGTTLTENKTNTGTVTERSTYNSDITEAHTGNDTMTRTNDTEEQTTVDGSVTKTNDNTQTSRTNGVVTQSVDTKNNQTKSEQTTNNGLTTTRNVSAYDSSTPVFASSDNVTGGNTTTTSYTGTQPDNQTTTTSINYGAANGDTITNDGSETTTDDTTTTKTNAGTITDATVYGSDVDTQKRGYDEDQRTDNLTQVTTNTISGTGSDEDITNGTKTNTHDADIHGSTGIFSKQALINQELELARFNLYDQIADCFINEFCIKIY